MSNLKVVLIPAHPNPALVSPDNMHRYASQLGYNGLGVHMSSMPDDMKAWTTWEEEFDEGLLGQVFEPVAHAALTLVVNTGREVRPETSGPLAGLTIHNSLSSLAVAALRVAHSSHRLTAVSEFAPWTDGDPNVHSLTGSVLERLTAPETYNTVVLNKGVHMVTSHTIDHLSQVATR